MPSARKVKWAQLRVGLMAIVAMFILAVLIFLLTGTKGLFIRKATLYTYMNDSAALAVGGASVLAGTDDGVFLDEGRGELRQLTVRHGLAGRETNRGAALVDRRGVGLRRPGAVHLRQFAALRPARWEASNHRCHAGKIDPAKGEAQVRSARRVPARAGCRLRLHRQSGQAHRR